MADPPPADPKLDDQPLDSALQRDSSTSRANEDHIPLESPKLGNGTLSAETFNWDYNYDFSTWEIDTDFYADHSYKNSIEQKEGEASVNYADTSLGNIETVVAPTLSTPHDFIEAQPRGSNRWPAPGRTRCCTGNRGQKTAGRGRSRPQLLSACCLME